MGSIYCLKIEKMVNDIKQWMWIWFKNRITDNQLTRFMVNDGINPMKEVFG